MSNSSTYNLKPALTNCSSLCPATGRDGANFGDVILDMINMSGAEGFTAVFMIQMILVAYLYVRVGKGKYWHTLLAVAIAGICGKTIENLGQVLFNYTSGDPKYFILSIIAEPFWIISEFGIVALNLIKVRTILTRKTFRLLFAAEFILFLTFCAFRIRIGITRHNTQQFNSAAVWNAHTPAFATVALAELIVTLAIIYIVVEQVRNEGKYINIRSAVHKHLFKSTFGVLLLVDLVGIAMAVVSVPDSDRIQQLLRPFVAIKSGFALILALDATCIKLVLNNLAASSGGGHGPSSNLPTHQQNQHQNYHPSGNNQKRARDVMSASRLGSRNKDDGTELDVLPRSFSPSYPPPGVLP